MAGKEAGLGLGLGLDPGQSKTKATWELGVSRLDVRSRQLTCTYQTPETIVSALHELIHFMLIII